jgi:catechol 2,3-dioxygenase-like lactoylglutathione lyase family enzyme
MISGVSHINLSVSNLETSWSFYCDLLKFKPLAKWPEGSYFLAGDLWFCINVDLETRKNPSTEYSHIAFFVDPSVFPILKKLVSDAGVNEWKENTSPGDSFYILDPDGHKLELHSSTWQDRISIAKSEKWKGMVFCV